MCFPGPDSLRAMTTSVTCKQITVRPHASSCTVRVRGKVEGIEVLPCYDTKVRLLDTFRSTALIRKVGWKVCGSNFTYLYSPSRASMHGEM
jgi:hypothetical protein